LPPSRAAPTQCAALLANARAVPALAAAVCSRRGAMVEQAMVASAQLVFDSPTAARRGLQDTFVRLGALEAAVQRLSAGGRVGGAAAGLVGASADGRPNDVARAAVAAGALPGLVAQRDADDWAATQAAVALNKLCVGRFASPAAAAAVDAGAVRALAAGLLGRAGVSVARLCAALRLLAWLARTPSGAERLVADGALPHIVRLLRSPARRVANGAVLCLSAAFPPGRGGAVAEALLADAAAAPAILALLLGRDGDAPFHAACVLGRVLGWALFGGPEASPHARGLAAAARRAGTVPRLVELLRATREGDRRRSFAPFVMAALTHVCEVDAAAAREALGAGAWADASRIVVEQDASPQRADSNLLEMSVSLLSDLAPHLCDGAPRPAAAAAEPGLVAARARALGRASDRGPLGTRALSHDDATTARNAAAVLEAVLEGADGAQRAAEFVDAGGAGHLVRAGQRRGRRPGGRWGLGVRM
jgi:hypothetical protein